MQKNEHFRLGAMGRGYMVTINVWTARTPDTRTYAVTMHVMYAAYHSTHVVSIPWHLDDSAALFFFLRWMLSVLHQERV